MGDRVIVNLDFSLLDCVVVDDGGLVVCDVFEEIFSVGVSECPDAGLGGFQILVDHDPSLWGCLDSRPFGVENVGWWASSAGNHDLLRFDRHGPSGLSV